MRSKRIGYQGFRRKPDRAVIDLGPKNIQRLEALTKDIPIGCTVVVELRLIIEEHEELG